MKVKSPGKLSPKITASKLFDDSDLVELWLSTMTEADQNPEPKLEVRPARLGLGYQVSRKSNIALKDPIESIFRRETAMQRKSAKNSDSAASKKGRKRDSIYEDYTESRCEAFGKKKRAVPQMTTVLEQIKKRKK